MSFESNDDRLDRLEKATSGNLEFNTRLVAVVKNVFTVNSEVMALILTLAEQVGGVQEFLIARLPSPDDDLKRRFQDHIAVTRKTLLEALAKCKTAEQAFQNLLPPLPPAPES